MGARRGETSRRHRRRGSCLDGAVGTGPAADVLRQAAKDAQLLVVGQRGGGGFMGLLLGSVSQQVAQYSPCPVVLVPLDES